MCVCGGLIGWLVVYLVGWFAGWYVDGLVGCPVAWLARWLNSTNSINLISYSMPNTSTKTVTVSPHGFSFSSKLCCSARRGCVAGGGGRGCVVGGGGRGRLQTPFVLEVSPMLPLKQGQCWSS